MGRGMKQRQTHKRAWNGYREERMKGDKINKNYVTIEVNLLTFNGCCIIILENAHQSFKVV
jgi:hypothetical protein